MNYPFEFRARSQVNGKEPPVAPDIVNDPVIGNHCVYDCRELGLVTTGKNVKVKCGELTIPGIESGRSFFLANPDLQFARRLAAGQSSQRIKKQAGKETTQGGTLHGTAPERTAMQPADQRQVSDRKGVSLRNTQLHPEPIAQMRERSKQGVLRSALRKRKPVGSGPLFSSFAAFISKA